MITVCVCVEGCDNGVSVCVCVCVCVSVCVLSGCNNGVCEYMCVCVCVCVCVLTACNNGVCEYVCLSVCVCVLTGCKSTNEPTCHVGLLCLDAHRHIRLDRNIFGIVTAYHNSRTNSRISRRGISSRSSSSRRGISSRSEDFIPVSGSVE